MDPSIDPPNIRPDGAAGPPSACEIIRPEVQSAPFVYCAPHSGLYYPPDLLAATRLALHTLRSSEDSFADRLFAAVKSLGAPLIRTNYARAYVDCNRAADELDPALFDGPVGMSVDRNSERVRVGLGVIPAVVSGGQRIYARSLPADEAARRLSRVYEPTHRALRQVLDVTVQRFGCAVLIDCHSMPSGVTLGRRSPRQTSDMVLGDAHGRACAPELTALAARTLQDMGYKVELNSPYAGGFNTRHYGRPRDGRHALQVEINRALYMDEWRMTPNARFDRIANDMTALARALHRIPVEDLKPAAPLAAE